MKILYVDTAYSGHHYQYFNSLVSKINLGEKVAIFPSNAPKNIIIKYNLDVDMKKTSIINYLFWLRKVYKVVKKEKPDIIHFLYGDFFYRYFGLFLGLFKNTKTVTTFHHIRRGKLRDLSIKHICRNINIAVVHTAKLKDDLKSMNINNVEHIEYPVFIDENVIGEIPDDVILDGCSNVKILAALGATRYDKGLDILLEALKNVKTDFRLIIAGAECDIKLNEIKTLTSSYQDKVLLHLDYLKDSELIGIIQASDIIVLPYRKEFDGASGPLTEGVYYSKLIIGPNHGSLGKIINDNNLGFTFCAENEIELATAIEKAINYNGSLPIAYKKYQKTLAEENFIQKYKELYQICIRKDY